MKSRWICKQCGEDIGKFVGSYYTILMCPYCGQHHVMTFFGLAKGTEGECLEYIANYHKQWLSLHQEEEL